MTYAAVEWIVVFGVVGTAAALMAREVSGWINAGSASQNGRGASGLCGGCGNGCERSPESIATVAIVPLNLDFVPERNSGD